MFAAHHPWWDSYFQMKASDSLLPSYPWMGGFSEWSKTTFLRNDEGRSMGLI